MKYVDAWVAPHRVIYKKMLAYLDEHPRLTSPSDFLSHEVSRLLKATTAGPHGYAGPYVQGGLFYRPVKGGEVLKFWNGSAVQDVRFEDNDFEVPDYVALAKKIIEMGKLIGHPAPLVLDLGAGPCLQAIALRAAGCSYPILNLDWIDEALEIGRRLSAKLRLQDIHFCKADMNVELADPHRAMDFRARILNHAGDRPIIAVSRFSIHPFYSIEECQRLFAFLTGGIASKAGVHLEMCGHRTDAYEELCHQLGVSLLVAEMIDNEPGDPLSYLERLPTIRVHERFQLWPHFVTTKFPSYLSWISSGIKATSVRTVLTAR
jgi:hypothetical protein